MSRDTDIINAADMNLTVQDVVTVRPATGYHLVWYIIFSLIFWFTVLCFAAHFFHDSINLPSQTPEFAQEFYDNLEDGVTPYLSGFIALFMLLFVRIAGSMYRKSLKQDGWLMKATAEGLYVQFRSYLNQHFDKGDDTVIFIPAEKVSWVREVRYTRVTKTRDGQRYEFIKGIEVQVRRMDVERVTAALKQEAQRKHSGWKWQDRPVEIHDNVLRVLFSGMRPSAASFVQKMRRWYMTQDMKKLDKETGKSVNIQSLTEEDEGHGFTEADIHKALEVGNSIEAIKIARLVHGIGLKEAKEYVDRIEI